jgi:hypothetical protein
MGWIIHYWYLILIGLVAAVFFFGYKTNNVPGEASGAHSEDQTDEKTKKSGHSCCH